jgi:hypothetical protein
MTKLMDAFCDETNFNFVISNGNKTKIRETLKGVGNNFRRNLQAFRGLWTPVYKNRTVHLNVTVFTMSGLFPYLYLLKRVYNLSHCNSVGPRVAHSCERDVSKFCLLTKITNLYKRDGYEYQRFTYTAPPCEVIQRGLSGNYEESHIP